MSELPQSGAKALEDHIGNGGLGYPFPEDDPEYGRFLASAWTSGYLAGTSERPPADVWVPVPLCWRHVAPGDVFVGRENRPWSVGAIGPVPNGSGLYADIYSGLQNWAGTVDPDDTVDVLVPVTERDAVELCREELGARLATQRTA